MFKKKIYRPQKSAGVTHKDRDKIIPRGEESSRVKVQRCARLGVPGAWGALGGWSRGEGMGEQQESGGCMMWGLKVGLLDHSMEFGFYSDWVGKPSEVLSRSVCWFNSHFNCIVSAAVFSKLLSLGVGKGVWAMGWVKRLLKLPKWEIPVALDWVSGKRDKEKCSDLAIDLDCTVHPI